jgi:hypothetical protein
VLLLRDYLACVPSLGAGEEYYGVAAVEYFVGEVNTVVQRAEVVDLRGTRTLMEHREIMVQNIRYIDGCVGLAESTRLLAAYTEVAGWAKKLHLLCCERNARGGPQSQKDRDLARHLATSADMISLDKQVIGALVEALRSSARSLV